MLIQLILGFPCGSAGKESDCNVGDLGLIPGLGGSPGEEKGYPLQYSGLENSIDCSPWSLPVPDTTDHVHMHACNAFIDDSDRVAEMTCMQN